MKIELPLVSICESLGRIVDADPRAEVWEGITAVLNALLEKATNILGRKADDDAHSFIYTLKPVGDKTSVAEAYVRACLMRDLLNPEWLRTSTLETN